MMTICLGLNRRVATSWTSAYHAPVLATEVLTFVGSAATAIDGTLGGGGHTAALLEHGVHQVVGIDRDPAALAAARERLAAYEAAGRFQAIHGNFADPAVLASLTTDGVD